MSALTAPVVLAALPRKGVRFRPPARLRGQFGFTLLELVIAFVVFALAFGALMQINASSLKAARRSAEYTQAALLAKSKLDEVGIGIELEEGGESGRFEGTAYEWQLEVTKEEPPLGATGLQEQVPLDLFRLDLTVRWRSTGNGAERETKFATLRAVQQGASP